MRRTPNGLTAKQRRVLAFVTSFINKHGYAPTRREIADHFNFASNAAADGHLRLIEKKGYLKLTTAISRGIQLL